MLGDTSFSGEAATLMKQVKPIKIYSNFKENRLDIIKEEKNKKGVNFLSFLFFYDVLIICKLKFCF